MGSTATGTGTADFGVDGDVGEGMGGPTVPPSNSPVPDVVPSHEVSIPLRVTTIYRVIWRLDGGIVLGASSLEASCSLDLTRTQLAKGALLLAALRSHQGCFFPSHRALPYCSSKVATMSASRRASCASPSLRVLAHTTTKRKKNSSTRMLVLVVKV